ncbi:MAG TPA: hypothetical protein VLC09_09835 [Polyangiaceae bacterium]|nr:hypothetical protein [Polyangiaceae bacterium]
MADDNKPKIDLKARLGKKTVTGVGPSIPPPMMNPGASIPAPPFGSRPTAAPEPEPVRVVESQSIKIEMGEEVVEAQKKARSKWLLVAAGTAFLGGLMGYVLGGRMEANRSYKNAAAGAGILLEDVDKANVEIEKLADALKKAKMALGDGRFPEAEINQFGEINIPFDATYLAGKGTGLMSGEINRLLIKFASDAANANEQKDRLKRVLGGSKTALTELFAEKDAPKVRWSVIVGNSPQGPIASMQLVPTPFLATSKEAGFSWPKEVELKSGDKTVKVERYTKGDPVGGSSPLLIPVDPTTQSSVCSSDTLSQLSREFNNLDTMLRGDKSDPTNEKVGLVDTGTLVVEKLKGVGG